jgi:hypothetical protein
MPSTYESRTQRAYTESTPVKFNFSTRAHGTMLPPKAAAEVDLPLEIECAVEEAADQDDCVGSSRTTDSNRIITRSGVVRAEPKVGNVPASDSFTAIDCPCCYRPLIVSWRDARPAGDVLQDAFGCDPADLYRFFEPDEWLTSWELPLYLVWGTASDWRTIAGLWRATRSRGEGRFLSLADIERGSNQGR